MATFILHFLFYSPAYQFTTLSCGRLSLARIFKRYTPPFASIKNIIVYKNIFSRPPSINPMKYSLQKLYLHIHTLKHTLDYTKL